MPSSQVHDGYWQRPRPNAKTIRINGFSLFAPPTADLPERCAGTRLPTGWIARLVEHRWPKARMILKTENATFLVTDFSILSAKRNMDDLQARSLIQNTATPFL
jgi:hypothetical protein